jgi:hypothetical protein
VDQRETRILVAFWLLTAVLIVGVVLLVTRENGVASAGTTFPSTTTVTVPTETTAVTTPTETTTVTTPTETTTVTSPQDTTTSLPAETTTTSAPDETTTTAAGETTTSSADTTSTSGAPAGDLVLEDDGIGGVSFGATPAETVEYATAELGPPANDSGWIDSDSKYGTCPRPEVRGVEWGSSDTGYGFVLLFTKAGTSYQPTGTEHFFGYYYVNADDPAGLATPEGLTIGTSVGEAEALYTDFAIGESPFDPQDGAWSVDSDPSADSLLWGIADGVDSTDSITTVNGGITCAQ